MGFTSQSHFNRAFKTHLGETPTNFRTRRQGARMA
ncbi:AraC family transcriptional regulator [Halomonas sp. ND22Bw]